MSYPGCVSATGPEPKYRPVDLDVNAASWILVQLLGMTIRFVVERPPIATEAFAEEMTRLVQGHPIANVSVMQ
ncbi:hypothetical protein [Mycobacterium shinjukuense]|uniref:Uncharacterized protein n=1 Tax=Mycobacterium shinjukuense TaxID=398694 RepID=A0A7I7MTE7_9MYCO|nr:hypothetical protein [Mycobacterium shinjukuense]ORB70641.1 hypothetical protein BST45_05720 [Mycobacterium shinjukuense]BBX75445.1 hypothetical protein MSHI_33510 [Mycobacterium shinjukuense]